QRPCQAIFQYSRRCTSRGAAVPASFCIEAMTSPSNLRDDPAGNAGNICKPLWTGHVPARIPKIELEKAPLHEDELSALERWVELRVVLDLLQVVHGWRRVRPLVRELDLLPVRPFREPAGLRDRSHEGHAARDLDVAGVLDLSIDEAERRGLDRHD